MKELIKVTTNDKGQQLVSARELHEFLEVKSRFNDWITNRINKYEFESEIDYTKFLVQCIRGQNEYDYALTIDMAKELSMVENNCKGKEARKYFIECEKKAKGIINDSQMDYVNAKAQMDLLAVTANTLNLNDSSKLLIATKIYEDCNIPTTYLPAYIDSRGILKSATELLKENNIPISTIKFNKIMIDKGYLIEVERTSGKDKSKIKKFKNLAKTEFGENQINPKNPKETQPMYYENKFLELLKELGIK